MENKLREFDYIDEAVDSCFMKLEDFAENVNLEIRNKLISVAGEEDLKDVQEITINGEINLEWRKLLPCLGDFLPNLKKLNLLNCDILTIRDLGVGLRSLESLIVSNCNLKHLDGIGIYTKLRDLDISYNFIEEIIHCRGLGALETLNLKSNKISKEAAIGCLRLNRNLSSLNVEENPVLLNHKCASGQLKKEFKIRINQALPQLKLFNEIPVVRVPPKYATTLSELTNSSNNSTVLTRKQLKLDPLSSTDLKLNQGKKATESGIGSLPKIKDNGRLCFQRMPKDHQMSLHSPCTGKMIHREGTKSSKNQTDKSRKLRRFIRQPFKEETFNSDCGVSTIQEIESTTSQEDKEEDCLVVEEYEKGFEALKMELRGWRASYSKHRTRSVRLKSEESLPPYVEDSDYQSACSTTDYSDAEFVGDGFEMSSLTERP